MNFLFFDLKSSYTCKTPASRSCSPHTQTPPASLVSKHSWGNCRQRSAPQQLTKARRSHQRNQQISARKLTQVTPPCWRCDGVSANITAKGSRIPGPTGPLYKGSAHKSRPMREASCFRHPGWCWALSGFFPATEMPGSDPTATSKRLLGNKGCGAKGAPEGFY